LHGIEPCFFGYNTENWFTSFSHTPGATAEAAEAMAERITR